jgi:anthranilate synthase component 1
MAADIETPASAFYKLRRAGAVFLLESVEHGAHFGRYSFIGLAPRAHAIVRADSLEIIQANTNGGKTPPGSRLSIDPQSALRALFSGAQITGSEDFPPLLGGVVGYIGYDMVSFFEPAVPSSSRMLKQPLAELFLIDTLVAFDHVRHEIVIMVLAGDSDPNGPAERISAIESVLLSPLEITSNKGNGKPIRPESFNFSREQFCGAVTSAKEYIASGDVYQIVLSQRLTGETSAEPFSIYRALRMLNPSPYMYYLDFGNRRVIGSSPEALVKLSGRQASVRPIAGTRPRGATPSEDRALAGDLLADEKERAEHVMLVDLGRNDLGRCSEFGSVKVQEYMEVERFSHVMHLCSTVTGTLRPDTGSFELFKSAFPAGTVSGAPKVRAMQLINEFEPVSRGLYSGAVGYASASGDMDWCIAIRTIQMIGSTYHLQAGAGIVADSVPGREYEETLHKLAALRCAITSAEETL